MSLDDNLKDLEQHARDFAGRRRFTYTVLSTGAGAGDVIGCVYIYPPSGPGPEARTAAASFFFVSHSRASMWVRSAGSSAASS
jgi:hypothetical protein